ncbi:Putative glycosyltransferase EpsH [Myxococcaceae bacterium]|nr:Putative glycosyltransferase EpsH [Myxococcaceae bacterium]
MRIRTRGMFLLRGEQKFFVRGVSYGPFRPNRMGEFLPEKDAVERDFALLRELGANTIRLYHVPAAGVRELAESFGLELLVGIPWAQHVRFLDTRDDRREVRRRVREAAISMRGATNLLALLVGNEISPQIIRWYGPARIEAFLRELVDEVKDVDPDALVSYANFPMTEFLQLDFLDFLSFNVYLHREADFRRYVARLQNLAGFKPLLLTEFGVDSFREGAEEQARIVSTTAEAAAEMGTAGTIVFSFTDEWFTGGHEIEDWAFGLVRRDREKKPAFAAVESVYREPQPRPPSPAPRVSVVICAYDAERTMEECLESLTRLRYPNFEVIVVDDGSTDRTREISERYPQFRLMSHENRGLSAARNEGILAATGEIVAFTDSDCAVDPDWLTFLVHRLLSESFAAVGGPNLPPPEDHWVPEVVARSPGGPTHVLLTDFEAEHVPGCNMAFWREKLLEVGLFDPVYRAAGDDVDICWRLQNAGYKIGFAASALVWHRRRATVSDYLAQQRGYGRAESLLYFKHPYRFNFLGNSRWLGRIYSDLGAGILGSRPVIYSGPFGSGLFQTLYEAPSSLLRHLPATLEWNLSALGLTAVGGFSLFTRFPVPTFLVVGLGLFLLSILQAVAISRQVDVHEVDAPAWKARLLIATLNYLGPFVRAIERNKTRMRGMSEVERISFPKLRQRPDIDLVGRSFRLSYWNTTGLEKEQCIFALLDFLRPRKYPIIIDNGWEPWDVSIHRGVWVRAEVTVLVQNHGGLDRQVDVGARLRQTGLAKGLAVAGALVGLLAFLAGLESVTGLLAASVVGFEAFLAYQAYRMGRTVYHAVEITSNALPLDPLRPDKTLERPQG